MPSALGCKLPVTLPAMAGTFERLKYCIMAYEPPSRASLGSISNKSICGEKTVEETAGRRLTEAQPIQWCANRR